MVSGTVFWAIALGGPLLGIVAVVLLTLLHEYGERVAQSEMARRLRLNLPPLPASRASTVVLDAYLEEEHSTGTVERRHQQLRLVTPVVRASTAVFETYLEEKEKVSVGAVAAIPRPPGRRRPAPVPRPALPPHPWRIPVAQPARPAVARLDRSPRPTRLVPIAS